MKKFLTWVFWVPIAAVLIGLSVANRKSVPFSLDPISLDDPLVSFQVPLFLLLLTAMLAGLVVGGVAAWLNQGKWRRAARGSTQRAPSHDASQGLSQTREMHRETAMSPAPQLPSPGNR